MITSRATIPVLALAYVLAATVAPARAGFVIQQGFAIGPNGASGSPSFAAWQSNAIQGLSNGFSNVGNPATDPTAFATVTGTNVRDIIPTGDFTSWNGQANPSGAFANELGNLLFAPVIVTGTNGTTFSLSQILFTGVSSDMPGNPAGSLLGNVTDLNNFSYSAGRVGVVFNADGSKTLITSGGPTQVVNELIYRGVGSFHQILTQAGTGQTGQQLLDAEAAQLSAFGPLTFSATYSIYKDCNEQGPCFAVVLSDRHPACGLGAGAVEHRPAGPRSGGALTLARSRRRLGRAFGANAAAESARVERLGS